MKTVTWNAGFRGMRSSMVVLARKASLINQLRFAKTPIAKRKVWTQVYEEFIWPEFEKSWNEKKLKQSAKK